MQQECSCGDSCPTCDKCDNPKCECFCEVDSDSDEKETDENDADADQEDWW